MMVMAAALAKLIFYDDPPIAVVSNNLAIGRMVPDAGTVKRGHLHCHRNSEAVGYQLVVREPFSAQVPDNQAAAKMEERGGRTDGNSAGIRPATAFRIFFGTSVLSKLRPAG
jgi:hypothetical protein